jgi:hypothetical protein
MSAPMTQHRRQQIEANIRGTVEAELLEEIRRLEAIVEKLPKTDDGVPVVPGVDKVYQWGQSRPPGGEWQDVVVEVTAPGWDTCKVLDQHLVMLGKTGARANRRRCATSSSTCSRARSASASSIPKGDWWGLKLAADGKGRASR